MFWSPVTHPFHPPHFTPWWRHQMETFAALLDICAGNSPVTGEFPAQRPVTRSFDVFFDLCLWINGWVNNREAGDLRRHCAHYDIIFTQPVVCHLPVTCLSPASWHHQILGVYEIIHKPLTGFFPNFSSQSYLDHWDPYTWKDGLYIETRPGSGQYMWVFRWFWWQHFLVIVITATCVSVFVFWNWFRKKMFKKYSLSLAHWGLVTPYGDIDLGQHGLR